MGGYDTPDACVVQLLNRPDKDRPNGVRGCRRALALKKVQGLLAVGKLRTYGAGEARAQYSLVQRLLERFGQAKQVEHAADADAFVVNQSGRLHNAGNLRCGPGTREDVGKERRAPLGEKRTWPPAKLLTFSEVTDDDSKPGDCFEW